MVLSSSSNKLHLYKEQPYEQKWVSLLLLSFLFLVVSVTYPVLPQTSTMEKHQTIVVDCSTLDICGSPEYASKHATPVITREELFLVIWKTWGQNAWLHVRGTLIRIFLMNCYWLFHKDQLQWEKVISFKIGRPRSRGWKTFRHRWTGVVGGLEN